VTDGSRLLGGYAPRAGLGSRQPGQINELPVPSLLRSLLSDHLDPGYAAAAAKRDDRPGRRWVWTAAAALLIAAVFAAAAAQAQTLAPGVMSAQRMLVASVKSAEHTADELTANRDALSAQVDEVARAELRDDAEGRQLLDRLDVLSLSAASTPIIGPGLSVTATDPGAGRDLSDVSKGRVPGSRQVILDRDLQLVVNSLWACGAEAVSVGGVRVGPNVTIRQAGGAVLVDNHPVASPYTIQAIGPPKGMREVFEHSPGLLRLRLLENSYGVGVAVTTGDGMTLPASTTRDITFARQRGR
jgi:uncharacterized protein YlxW (UPF0749 family)